MDPKDYKLVKKMYDAVIISILILDKNREAAFANSEFLKIIEGDEDSVKEKRLGEIFHCVNTNEKRCGESSFCRYCGANRAIMKSLSGEESTMECDIIQKLDDRSYSLNLLVNSAPLQMSKKDYLVFSIMDISDRKRKRNLERLFFHDLLNIAGTIQSGLSLILEKPGILDEAFIDEFRRVPEKLIEEIKYQKDLSAAENNDLKVHWEYAILEEIVHHVCSLYRGLKKYRGIALKIENFDSKLIVETDQVLLGRILGNMLKNALEASQVGDVIKISLEKNAEDYLIHVWNSLYIPLEIQSRIFKRSFSTKGNNRGLGTYAIKTLTENYLGGKVGFSSNENTGTVFSLRFPYKRKPLKK